MKMAFHMVLFAIRILIDVITVIASGIDLIFFKLTRGTTYMQE